LNAISIAKLASSVKDLQHQSSISIKAKANSAMLIDTPMSQQSAMIHFNNDSLQFIVKYIYLLGSEGAHTACKMIVKYLKPIQPDLIWIWQGSGDGVHGF
jgi:hypothetical protein